MNLNPLNEKKSKKPEFSLSALQANPVQLKQLLGFIEEIVLCEGKIKAEKEAIKDIRGEAEQQLGIPNSILSDLVRERIDQGSIDDKIQKLELTKEIAVGLGISEE